MRQPDYEHGETIDDVADEAYEEARQEEVDNAADALRAHEEAVLRRPPTPQPCHKCERPYAGIVCPICKEERPAYTALKNITAQRVKAAIADDSDVASIARHCGAV